MATAPRDPRAAPVGSRADRARTVAGVLRQQVLLGSFPSGLLPEEGRLVADFGESRNAVREALRLLGEEGLVERRRGIGTVVLARALPHPLDRLAGLAETLGPHGTVTSRVRRTVTLRPPPEVARRLGLAAGEEAVYLERLRLLDEEPVSLDCTYLTPEVGRPLMALAPERLTGQDVFRLIEEELGLRLGHAEVAVRASIADPATAGALALAGPAALLLVERLTHLRDGRPVDLEFLHLRGDRVSLHAVLERGAGAASTAP